MTPLEGRNLELVNLLFLWSCVFDGR